MAGIIRKWLEDNLLITTPKSILIAILALIVLGLLISLPVGKWRSQRANQLLGIVIAMLLLFVVGADSTFRWQVIVGLLPAILVAYQAFFLWLYHPKTKDGRDHQRSPSQASIDRARSAVNSHFGLRTLSIRYGFPAILLAVAGIIILDVIVSSDHFVKVFEEQQLLVLTHESIRTLFLGLTFGAAGAYVYVLLDLGRRTFRHDVTGASAMWCLVTLILGPVLAATVAVLWHVDKPAEQGWWGGGVVLFFTGFAPRRVIAAIEQAAVQLLKIGTQTSVVENRQIPLGKVRGIGPQVEERLGEEGILDVNSLATAEPLRLIRNTSFDMKQILGWIDEAILIATLPKQWEAIEETGITGAIDLAWYYYLVIDKGQQVNPLPQEVTDIANDIKMPIQSFVSTIVRLYEDQQVQYIWALYNGFSEFAGTDPNGRRLESIFDGNSRCFILVTDDDFHRFLV